jgi:hypothetical protein
MVVTSSARSHDPTAAVSAVLSEVLDMVQDVKQVRRKVPGKNEMHDEVSRLFDDLLTWAHLLMDEDEELGLSPLGSVPSAAGRRPPNLFPADPTDDEVRRVLLEHLDRLADHLAVAAGQQDDEGARSVLVEIQRGLAVHRQALSS